MAILIYKQQKCNKLFKKKQIPRTPSLFFSMLLFYVTSIVITDFYFFLATHTIDIQTCSLWLFLFQLYQGATDQRHAAIQSKDVQSLERKLPEIGLIPSDHRYITLDVGTLLTSVGGWGERKSRKGDVFSKQWSFQVFVLRVFFSLAGFFGAKMWRWERSERSGSYLHSCGKNSDENQCHQIRETVKV